jgi:hypothetical protein
VFLSAVLIGTIDFIAAAAAADAAAAAANAAATNGDLL